ncbi:hypothetical protein HY409_03615 [Candidatus Gottesmanbacteria bacterium]|nr:hypothetical protein [Candidatus Gottesmanbacteria bacterium]
MLEERPLILRDLIPQEPIIDGLKANRPFVYHGDNDELILLGSTPGGITFSVKYNPEMGWEGFKTFTYEDRLMTVKCRVCNSVPMSDSEIYGFRNLLPNCRNFNGLRLATSEDFNGEIP